MNKLLKTTREVLLLTGLDLFQVAALFILLGVSTDILARLVACISNSEAK